MENHIFYKIDYHGEVILGDRYELMSLQEHYTNIKQVCMFVY